ncbi:PQQ-binding-like beta-propeller repeat protein [Halorubellus sp. PRR65]|uniref:outer membrane protein assembly factor BamB family protein n=1 Tax=Halorubellus sp. PRR65 TaxID=3098148 RepID=UPI002B2638C2|nr:PQQ-binding-like beta-propeller repeat protein [Halorubellus sp. PRR65]
MRSRRRFLAVAGATLGAVGLAGCGALPDSDGAGEDGGSGRTTTGDDQIGPNPGYGAVETTRTEPNAAPPGDPPTGDAVAWSVPVGAPVTARPVVAGDALFLGAGEHDGGERPGVDAELRPRFPGYVHAVGLDGERRFEYAAPAPVLDVAPVAGDDAARRARDVATGSEDGDASWAASAGRASGLGAYAVLGWYGGPGGVGHRLTRVTRGVPRWADATADANRFVAASTADAVVTGTRDERVALTGERLTARSPGGGYRWRVESGDVLAGTGSGDRVYLTVGTRRTVCLDARTGETAWSYRGTAPTWTPRVQGDVVFVARNRRTGSGGHPLVAVDAATGRERWTFAGRGDAAFTPRAAVRAPGSTAGTADAVVYAAGTNGGLRAIAGGRQRWRTRLPGRVVDGPVVAAGTVYATDTRGVLYAVDASTGERAWDVDLGLPSRTLDAGTDGVVAVAASDGAPDGDAYRVRGYGHDGEERFAHDATEGVLAAVARGARGYVVTDGGHLAAFDR